MALYFTRDVEILERFQWKVEKMSRDLEHITYEEKLRKLCLFSLMKRKLRDNLTAMYNYLYSSYKDNEAQLL